MAGGGPMPATARRRYDHHIREYVAAGGDPRGLGVALPRSTRLSWLRRPVPEVQTCSSAGDLATLAALRTRVAVLSATVRLLVVLVRLTGAKRETAALADASQKTRVLHAVEHARKQLPLRSVLRILGLSESRYH